MCLFWGSHHLFILMMDRVLSPLPRCSPQCAQFERHIVEVKEMVTSDWDPRLSPGPHTFWLSCLPKSTQAHSNFFFATLQSELSFQNINLIMLPSPALKYFPLLLGRDQSDVPYEIWLGLTLPWVPSLTWYDFSPWPWRSSHTVLDLLTSSCPGPLRMSSMLSFPVPLTLSKHTFVLKTPARSTLLRDFFPA